MKQNVMTELDEEQLAQVEGGLINGCTMFGGLTAATVGFALGGLGIATMGWGALAGSIAYGVCSLGEDAPLGQLSDIAAP